MFHAFVQKFDEMDEKILGEKLNRAWVNALALSLHSAPASTTANLLFN